MSKTKTKKARKVIGQPELSSHVIGAHNIDEVISRIVKKDVDPRFIVIDLFCGAGGTSTGFEMAGSVAMVVACVNHDKNAIKSHWENYPGVAHFEEDIRTLDLRPLIKLLNYYRALYPNAKVILWASLECTNFSKAKGGLPRDADSRTLAIHLHRYVEALLPDYVQIENVVEFMSWGPLDENGKPISRRNGEEFMKWCNAMCAHGYVNEWRELNSADFGAYTSRNRLFGIFARPELPIAWPEPTHAKKAVNGMFGSLKPWKAVKEVLDFSDEGKSIFDRRKPLSEKTLERIYAGLIKYVAGGKEAFMLKYNSTDKKGVHRPPSIDEPCPTIATQNRLGVVQASFIQKYYSGKPDGKVISTDGPAGTICTVDTQALVQPHFLAQYYGCINVSDTDTAHPTLTTKDRSALIRPKWLDPAFITPTNFDNQPTSIEQPLGTITANRKWHYLVNPSWGGNPQSTDQPCPVIVARQDKAPLYIVISEQGDIAIRIDETDSPCMRKIKEFMVLYCIVDIKMRMLLIKELLLIQGLMEKGGKVYKLAGSQAQQKKCIGNSVVPLIVESWTIALDNAAIALESFAA